MNIQSSSHVQEQFGQFSEGLTKDFAVVETILRDRHQFFQEIREGNGIQEKMRSMLISSTAFLAVYGAVLGSTHSLLQALSSAMKLPLLFLITFAICIPALYVLSILFGSNQRLRQSIALVLSAITVTAVLLLSFAPIAFFFMLTTSGYQFFKLLNVLFFAIAGGLGMVFLSQGVQVVSTSDRQEGTKMRRLLLYVWIVLYAFVGSQMAWTLRPYIGYPDARFELIRELGGNFYSNILISMGEVLGFLIVR
jgi:uncharacterized membrane protein